MATPFCVGRGTLLVVAWLGTMKCKYFTVNYDIPNRLCTTFCEKIALFWEHFYFCRKMIPNNFLVCCTLKHSYILKHFECELLYIGCNIYLPLPSYSNTVILLSKVHKRISFECLVKVLIIGLSSKIFKKA